MNQNIWGSSLWFSLHTITMNYPNIPTYVDKQDYKNFFISLQYVIPCSVCRKNYQRHLKELPIENALESRQKLVYWLIDIHNLVNAEIGKKIMSYKNVIKKYEKIYSKKIFDDDFIEKFENNKIIRHNYYLYIALFIIILIIILIIIIYYQINSKKKIKK
jgi:hypothetical protein